jgi:succinate dehydrogenase / fumarate reductase membrane anchor subunit
MNSPPRVLGWGSAKYGVERWLVQRVSALALVLLSGWFAVALPSISTMSYPALVAWMGHGWNALLLIAFVITAAQHSYLGLRVVVEDYVSQPGTRLAALVLLCFAHLLLAGAATFAVLETAFGRLT